MADGSAAHFWSVNDLNWTSFTFAMFRIVDGSGNAGYEAGWDELLS
jgi:hypothetical protein